MSEETAPVPVAPPAPAAQVNEVKVGSTVACRFRNEAERKRFEEVILNRVKKGKTRSVSEFIWQLFEYSEKNPYGDFYTGK